MKPTALPFTGPRRLILIHSGKYDYAEIDLTRPFQLVGVNGLGKTALISTLQYLYLDSQSDMRFGQHGTAESRKFYFRDEASFILFECDTSLGTVVLGARGQGAAGGNELQRFAWTGSYQRSDFISLENRPRNWDEVKIGLAGKGLKVLTENAELRGLLGAVESETEASWGLVPLADPNDYRRFRQTFQRLLQLRDIRQDDLKQLLADCAKLGPSQREIDLAKEFEKELGRITRDRAEVTILRGAEPQVKEVRRLYDEEFVARAIAHAVARELVERDAGYTAELKRNTDSIIKVRDQAEADRKRLEGEQKTLQGEWSRVQQQTGRVRTKLEELTKEKERFATFVFEIEEQARVNLASEVAGLRSRLEDLPKEPLEVLARQLHEKRAVLKQREQGAARLSDLFVTWLRARLTEESVAKAGALFDRSILESVMDEGIRVLDENALLRRLKNLAAACDARGYRDDMVELEFSVGALSSVQRIGRIEQLEEEIRDLKRQITRLERDIETLRDAEPWKARLRKAEIDHTWQIERLSGFRRFSEQRAKEPADLDELKRLSDEATQWLERLQQNEKDRSHAETTRTAAIERFQQLEKEDAEIRKEARSMPVAEGEAPGRTPLTDAFVKDLPTSLLEVFRIARDRCGKARTLAQQLTDKVSLLDRDFVNASFRYDASAPLQDRLVQLETEITSLDERSLSIENRWTAVLTEARRSFHTILKSLSEVTKQARKLTGELGKIEFSSISQVRLEVVQNAAAVSEYERHAKDAVQPSLFDTAEEADRKLNQFHALLQRRPRLVLNDLFSLRCDVLRKDGQKNSYDDFDQVESTGTTIVLKVTLNLLVLRDLLIPGRARIPYYLDEVHALDRQNFHNILELSERLGFVGIYAAPTAAIGPRRYVHLVPDTKGRLVVTAAHQKDIIRTPEEPIDGSAENPSE
jgi:hypothetical protein